MPGEDIYSWSVTAVNNGNSDSAIEWREGQTRASVNNSSRSEMAAHAKHRVLTDGSIHTTNVGNAYAFTSGIGYTTVPTGMRVTLKIATGATNTDTSTLNMDGIGDVTIKTDQGAELKGGELTGDAYTDFLYDGTNWIFLYSRAFFFDLITSGEGVIIGTQVFTTPGTFTYTPSSELVQCAIVECIGAGGAGGAGFSTLVNTFFQGGGGGGGGYSRKTVTSAAIGASQIITVGTGGAAASSTGGAGGATSFGSLCVANGGSGGSGANYDLNPDGGLGASPGTGDIAVAGTPGHFGWFSRDTISTVSMTGNGGSGPLGGGACSHIVSAGTNATGYGAGGAGGSMWQGGGLNVGGAGSGGLVIVTEFGGRGSPGRDGADGLPGPTGPTGPTGPSGPGTGDVLRSGTPVATQIAQWTDGSHIRGVDIASVIASSFSTGDIKPTFKITPDAGWVILDDRTIGSASSVATNRANADTLDLYTLLWNNIANAAAPVSGGRGASAAADFAANKTLTLPKALGRAMMGAGAGASLTTRALGAAIGAETETQTIAKMAAHTHTYGAPGSTFGVVSAAGLGNDSVPAYWANGPFNTGVTVSTGSGAPLDIMQPSFAVNFMCKL